MKPRLLFEGMAARNGENLTCLRIAQNAVIDAGFLNNPTQDDLLEHAFISHAHLDHILALAFYVDDNLPFMKRPLTIYGSQESVDFIRAHFFNDRIWPDFTKIKLSDGKSPSIRYFVIRRGDSIMLEDLKIEAVSSLHMPGSMGFILTHGENSIYFTSDSGYTDNIPKVINERPDIKQVIIEVSFPRAYQDLAKISKHLTPADLERIKAECRKDVYFHIFHLKPTYLKDLERELAGVMREGEYILESGSPIEYEPSSTPPVSNLSGPQKLRTLFESFELLSRETDPRRVVYELSLMMKKIISADRCSFWILENDELFTQIADGIEGELRMKADVGLVGWCVQNNCHLIENNPLSNPHFNPETDRKSGYKTRSIITVPVYGNDKKAPIGAFQILNKLTNLDGHFSEDDLEYVKLAADYSGRIYEAFKLNEEIEKSQRDVIYAISEMVETKSKETGTHVQRVALYAHAIGKAMGLGHEDLQLILWGAPTHDLGKLAVPDNILNKPGRHSAAEFEIMKSHAEAGHRLLAFSSRPFMKAAAIIALEHHERWNGKGYPRGLRGKEIHIYARIVALADAFDAMISKRCYKEAMPIYYVLEEIRRERGEHFDPEVVDAFFSCIKEIMKIKEEAGE